MERLVTPRMSALVRVPADLQDRQVISHEGEVIGTAVGILFDTSGFQSQFYEIQLDDSLGFSRSSLVPVEVVGVSEHSTLVARCSTQHVIAAPEFNAAAGSNGAFVAAIQAHFQFSG